MRWIVERALRIRGFVAAASAVLIAAGIWQLRSAQVDSLPEFSPPTVQIQTEALGLSAREVEQLITVPMEQDLLAGLPWLDTIRSESIEGLSSVELIFDPGTDLLRARQAVQERLTQAAGLPNVSAPPQMIQPLSSTARIMMIRLSSSSVSPIAMSVQARWTVRPRLLGVPGVANVSIWGQRERQLQVQVSPERLHEHGLSLDRVIETTGNALWASPLTFLEASTPGTGGFIDTPNQRLSIQHLQPITTAKDLAAVPIESARGTVLRLGDVADVVEDHQPLIGDAVFTDGDPGLLLVIEKFPGTNTVDVTRGVDEALDALRPGLSGIDIDSTLYRPATAIASSFEQLAVRLLIGAALLLLVLLILWRGWRAALVAAVAIASAFAAAWLILQARDMPVNTFVVVGLVMALFVVIDDAVGDADTIVRRLREKRMNGVEPPASETILRASLEMRGSAVFASIIALVALVPMLFLHGRAEPFVPSVALAYALAITCSFLVALIVTPALCLLLLPRSPLERSESRATRWIERGYERLLGGSLNAPLITYAATGTLVVIALSVVPFARNVPLPSFRDRTLMVEWNALPGTSLPEMDRITRRVGEELGGVPGVRDVGASVGRAITSDQVVGVDSGQLWLTLDPEADYDATLARVRGVVAGYPGIQHSVVTYSDERIASVLPDAAHPLVVRLFGQDLDVLHDEATKVIDSISGIEGVVGATTNAVPQEPTVDVSVDLAAAERYGIVPGDVRRAAATLLSGIGVGSLFEQQKVFDVVVRGAPQDGDSLTSVEDLLIDTPNGVVPLRNVADVSIHPTPSVIRHQDLSRTVDVVADVAGRDVGDVLNDAQARLAQMRFPLEYHAELIRDVQDRQGAHRETIVVLIAAAIGVLLLLQAAFGSWRRALIAFLILPLALAGCMFAIALDGGIVSLGTLAGLVAVFGISMRQGVTLIRHYQRINAADGTAGQALVLRGTRERLGPILITGIAGIAALLPVALSGAVAGQEVLHPMVVVMLGGVVASILVNLFLVPIVYARFAAAPPDEPAAPESVVTIPEVEHQPGV